MVVVWLLVAVVCNPIAPGCKWTVMHTFQSQAECQTVVTELKSLPGALYRYPKCDPQVSWPKGH